MYPISVLMVSTEYPPMPGGVGRYTRNLALALKKLGVNVYVACNERGEGDFFGLDASNKENSRTLLRIVNQIKPDLVHVQLEHGLYGLNFGSIKNFRMQTNIDQFYEECQTPTITTFHSAYPIEQWINLVPSNHPTKFRLLDIPIELSSLALKYGNRMVTYGLFNRANREKMLRSAASVAFSEYMAKLLSTRNYKVNVIYHGAEPSLMNRPTMEVARSYYSLPLDRKIALALGFATYTKGWEILKEMKIPDNWTILVNHSRNYYSNENDVPNSLHLITNSDCGDHHQVSHGLLELNLGFLPDDALSLLFYASDTVIMPYSVASASGVMFDALAHGLPFVASDLGFFKEFAKKGLGIVVRRNPFEFSEALKMLESDYPHYKKEVERFKSNLNWDSVAKQHVEIYTRVLAKNHEFQSVVPETMKRRIL
jgi:glycosyltransferase involved in cell wall biosynthesis